MTRFDDSLEVDGIQVVRLQSDHLSVDVAPEVGGRVMESRSEISLADDSPCPTRSRYTRRAG